MPPPGWLAGATAAEPPLKKAASIAGFVSGGMLVPAQASAPPTQSMPPTQAQSATMTTSQPMAVDSPPPPAGTAAAASSSPAPPTSQTADGHIGLLTKLVLQQAQMVRSLNSAIYTTFILDASVPSIVEAQSAARKYSEEVTRVGKGHTLGPPHSHIVAAFLHQAMQDLAPRIQILGPGHRESSIAQKMYMLISASPTPDAVALIVSHFVVKEVYKAPEDARQRVRVWYSFKPAHTAMLADPDLAPAMMCLAMNWILSELGGEAKANTAPKGPMERAAEKVLTSRKPGRRR